jgi:hypothetical protein
MSGTLDGAIRKEPRPPNYWRARHRYTGLRCKGCFPGPDEVEVKNVEAQAHRAINDDCLLGVFARLDIQRDDEPLSLRLWCPTSKPIFDLPRTMNTSTRSAMK